MAYSEHHASEKQSEANKRFRENNPEKVRAAQRDWYERNRQHSIDRNREWRKKNPDGNFNQHLKRKYGLSRAQYDEMVIKQNNLCAICASPPVGLVKGKPATKLDVDHCHKTGKVRGLICHPCNVMLGQARDNIKTLESAIVYLKRSQDAT